MAQAVPGIADEHVLAPRENGKHIVEVLIEERCQDLMRRPLWPLWRSILYPLLRKPDAVKMADFVAPMTASGVMDHLGERLSMDLAVTGVERVPATGRVLVAPTHPTGIADGVALYEALKSRRPDMIFFANRDAIRAAPQRADILIPVEWVEEKRTRERSRETLMAAKRAFDDDRCVVLFPSGRIAFMDAQKRLNEQPWLTTVTSYARKYACPVVPVNIRARNSWLYYWFWKLNTELRDITLFNELLNKKGKRFEIDVGDAIPPGALNGDIDAVTQALRAHAVNDVPAGRPWRPVE